MRNVPPSLCDANVDSTSYPDSPGKSTNRSAMYADWRLCLDSSALRNKGGHFSPKKCQATSSDEFVIG
ncbi:unnamed protein product [Allacma fusca]|uniref:Uncharacterized protein n=1 Tax=Allacma fusca TaxID=39272 RepID=A0A8J2JSS4_9HEXA|nr:unnamed protein product [Allacma fusca]